MKFILILFLVLYGCSNPNAVLDGVYEENVGHPFSGPAIITNNGYYRLSGSLAEEVSSLESGTKVKVNGIISEKEIVIPESGSFRRIKEKTIEVRSFEIKQYVKAE